MPLKYADRVFESCSNAPLPATEFNLSGAKAGAQSFVAGIGVGSSCVYCAQAVDGAGVLEGAWEIGIGAVSAGSPDTLSRTHILRSSAANAAVNFSAATAVEVFVVDPAGQVTNSFQPGLDPDKYYSGSPYDMNDAPGGYTLLFNYVSFMPMYIPHHTVLSEMGVNVVTADNFSNIRLGLYDNADGVPQNLLLNAGELNLAATGYAAISSINLLIEPGWYFLAVHSEGNGAAGITGQDFTNFTALVNGSPDPTIAAANKHEISLRSVDYASGWPSPVAKAALIYDWLDVPKVICRFGGL